MMGRGPPILAADNVSKLFQRSGWPRTDATVRAVVNVSLAVWPREAVGLVGESGSGKTTIARILLNIEMPSTGLVRFDGVELRAASRAQFRAYRSSVQAVFQDPWSSLNPRMRIWRTVAEPLVVSGISPSGARIRAEAALADVGLDSDAGARYPHEFSGGQRQRVAIARAIALRPRLIILDEPVSSLDVSVRAQIMNLLMDLRSSLGVSYLLISHDLATVRFLVDRVVVMRHGEIIEQGPADAVFDRPSHAYTASLIAAARLINATKSPAAAS
jgi:ABC-type microcin C transport system duplicated ATPase subunit YejF